MRFSAKALGPSLASSEREDGLAVLELVRERLLLGHAVGLAQRPQDGLDRERTVVGIVSAISSALASAWPSGTTWPMSPMRAASSAVMCLR